MSSKVKPTLETVAKAAGVSVATVSIALRGRVGIGEDTRARVREVAARLGYQINSVASLLAQQRHNKLSATKRIPVALLQFDASENPFFSAACEACGVDGRLFSVDAFSSPEHINRVLWHQGIAGVVVRSWNFPNSEEFIRRFDWSKFSVIKIGRIFPLASHLVRHSSFDYMMTVLQQVAQRGYIRLAVLLHDSGTERDDMARLGALLAFKDRYPHISIDWRVPEQRYLNRLDKETISWIKDIQPDALIIYHWLTLFPLLAANFKIPEQIGVASILTSPRNKHRNIPILCGCETHHEELYLRSLSVLKNLILYGEKGLPTHPMEHVIEPTWVEGETLPWKNSPHPSVPTQE